MSYEKERLINRTTEDVDSPLLVPKKFEDDETEDTPIVIKKTTERLSSLDAFRGFTIFFMNLVNNSEFVDGSISFKPFSHSDWNGVTIADLVMPFFLFIVGASIVLSHSKLQKSGVSRLELVKKAAIRSCKLFALGLFLQGANFPDYDLSTLRIPGVLQRIAITYFMVVLIELFVPKNEAVGLPVLQKGPFQVLVNYCLQWLCGLVIAAIYLSITFGLYVPGCGRGSLKDYCNAAGYVDYHVLTVNHMYPEPTCLQSTPPCPYFDPEGILSTFFAAVSPLIGLYFGYMLVHYTTHKDRLFQWIPPALVFIILSLPLHFTGVIPYNKNLYSLSYVLLTSGLAAITFSLFYFIIDVKGIRKPFVPFIWLGMNAIIIYFGDGFGPTVVSWVYWKDPNNNLWLWAHTLFNKHLGTHWGNFVWALCDTTFWTGIAGILYYKKIFVKI